MNFDLHERQLLTIEPYAFFSGCFAAVKETKMSTNLLEGDLLLYLYMRTHIGERILYSVCTLHAHCLVQSKLSPQTPK